LPFKLRKFFVRVSPNLLNAPFSRLVFSLYLLSASPLHPDSPFPLLTFIGAPPLFFSLLANLIQVTSPPVGRVSSPFQLTHLSIVFFFFVSHLPSAPSVNPKFLPHRYLFSGHRPEPPSFLTPRITPTERGFFTRCAGANIPIMNVFFALQTTFYPPFNGDRVFRPFRSRFCSFHPFGDSISGPCPPPARTSFSDGHEGFVSPMVLSVSPSRRLSPSFPFDVCWRRK